MSQSLLALLGLRKRYSKSVEIGPIDMELAAGQFLSLLGPSGCGKSTLLRCIAGFEHVDSGDIRIRGRSILKDAPHRRNVGFVFQNYALFPHLTVADNVAFGLRRRHVEKKVCLRRTGEILERVGLEQHAARRPSELSGGQQQRVALARVLVLDPSVLLLDEPLSNLDRKLRIQMRAEFRRVHREFKKTIVYVTHDQEEALALSDRIAVMLGHDGIAQIGTPSEIYETPKNDLIADFIGDCNTFPAIVVEDANGVLEMDSPSGIRWRTRAAGFRPSGSAVNVLFRPDRVRFGFVDEPDANCFPVTVKESSYVGERINYVGVMDCGEQVRITAPAPRGNGVIAVGERITCTVCADSLFVFDRT